MKMKIFLALVLSLMAFSLLSAEENHPKQLYANLVFTVFELDDVKTDIASKIDIPIPEVYTQSWIHTHVSFDIADGTARKKVINKEEYRFILSADSEKNLSIQIMHKNQDRFYFEHRQPSTAHYIFYGPDNRVFLMEVLFTTANHRMGPIGPGIRKGGNRSGIPF